MSQKQHLPFLLTGGGVTLIALIDFYHQVAGAVNSPLIRLRVRPDHTYHLPDRVITAYARAVNHTIRGG